MLNLQRYFFGFSCRSVSLLFLISFLIVTVSPHYLKGEVVFDGPVVSQLNYFSTKLMAAGDLNNDGVDDFALLAPSNKLRIIYVFGVAGDGKSLRLSAPVDVDLPPNSAATVGENIAIVDIDGDASKEIVTTSISGSSVIVTKRAPSGTWSASVVATGLGAPLRFLVDDINGDAKVDILTSDRNATPASISLLLNTGSAFSNTTTLLDYQGKPTSSYELRFRSLGRGVAQLAPITARSNVVGMLSWAKAGGGVPIKQNGLYLGADIATSYPCSGDFNGDGNTDIAVAGSGFLSLLLADVSANFQIGSKIDIPGNPDYMICADVNGDKREDILFAMQPTTGGVMDGIWLLETRQKEVGSSVDFFAPKRLSTNGNAMSVTQMFSVGDFNGDKRLDVAAVSSDLITHINTTPILQGLQLSLSQVQVGGAISGQVLLDKAATFFNEQACVSVGLSYSPADLVLGPFSVPFCFSDSPSQSGQFILSAKKEGNLTITASLNGVSKQASVKILAGGASCDSCCAPCSCPCPPQNLKIVN